MGEADRPDPPIAPEIAAHYASGYEATRLLQGTSRLERARTELILTRYLPPPPATIVDVAGGAGAYACWLARLGYEVHLRDAMPIHVELARQASAQQPDHPLRSARLGDARSLDLPAASVDAALLLGPLYHLTERQDRISDLVEARRVLRPGGVAFVVGISRFASLHDGLRHDRLDDQVFVGIVQQDLKDGQHRNPANHPAYFTAAFLHHPDELAAEATEAGLDVEALLAVEGPAGLIRDFDSWWTDDRRRALLLGLVAVVETERSLMGVSPHILVVARKGGAEPAGQSE